MVRGGKEVWKCVRRKKEKIRMVAKVVAGVASALNSNHHAASLLE
jgi:hypothetical protein